MTKPISIEYRETPGAGQAAALRGYAAGAHTSRQHGLTLIELLVAVGILAVGLTLGVPSFRDLIDSNRLTAATNSLVVSMNVARFEAVKRREPVALCTSTDGSSCSGSTDWAGGWIVFTNRDWSSPPSVGVNDEVIQVVQSLGQKVDLSGSHGYVQYLPTGASSAY